MNNFRSQEYSPAERTTHRMKCDPVQWYKPVCGNVIAEKSGRGTVAEDRRRTLGYDHIVISRHLANRNVSASLAKIQ